MGYNGQKYHYEKASYHLNAYVATGHFRSKRFR